MRIRTSSLDALRDVAASLGLRGARSSRERAELARMRRSGGRCDEAPLAT